MLAGLIRTLGTIIMVWFVFRWLDRMFGGRRRRSSQNSSASNAQATSEQDSTNKAAPKDAKLGDYIDFEEVDES